ncbi:MAG: site-2 protease family protein [Chloroflexi bacterium]|nr:site-2 protease family protein [Chloroflexota bacterium]
MKASFKLARIAGIDIGVHYTWLFAFAIISWSLAAGLFPDSYPGWRTFAYWATGILSSLLLFLSVLLHELAHSFLALARGLPVHGITLFIFGGVSNLGGEAVRARDEFAIAFVGPLASLVLAGVFWILLEVSGNGDGPLGAILWYLALVNALLGIFNLLPGFPLDGGRVLRSLIWGATGSFARATRIATGVGQAFGWMLIALGVFQILQGNVIGGLWFAFIGWFLMSMAESSRREVTQREQFQGVRVSQVMDSSPDTVAPDTSVEELVRRWFLQRGRRAAPVCDSDNLKGIITLTDVKGLPQHRWNSTAVRDVMTRQPIYSVGPDDDLNGALRLLAEHDLNQVLVLQEGRLVGMLTRADVIRYLQMRQELGLRRS